MAVENYNSKKVRKGRKTNEVGNTYGRLKVVSEAESKGIHSAWNCICECGNETVVTGTHLRTGHTSSCGCLQQENRIKHGVHSRKEYQVWNGMMTRCFNPNSENYGNYGGRGITVCERWVESPNNFIDDMGDCPPGMSIERIDNDGDYEPSNCRWATQKEQARNKRTSNIIEFDGKKMCESAWAESLGIKRSTLRNRLTVRGWSIEKSLTQPVRFKAKN